MRDTIQDGRRSPGPEVAAGAVDEPGFHNAMAHLYRAEMHRLTTWRTRLDTTTNWALLLTTGMTTFTLGTTAIPHYTLLLGLALIGMCLVIEARRYQYLLHSQWRLQVLEGNYFATHLVPARAQGIATWRSQLSADLCDPRLTTDWLTAFRLRLRRNYLMIIFFITGVWLTKVFLHPQSPASPSEFYARLAVSDLIPSWLVAWTAAIFVGTSTYLAATSPTEESLGRAALQERERVDQGFPPAG